MKRTFSSWLSIGAATTVLFGTAAGSPVLGQKIALQPDGTIVQVRRLLHQQTLPEILPGVRRIDVDATRTAVVRLLQITSIRRHIHRANTEYVYVVDGVGRVMLGSRSHPIQPGDLVVIPAGTPHAFSADSGTLNLLNFASPPDTPQRTTWL